MAVVDPLRDNVLRALGGVLCEAGIEVAAARAALRLDPLAGGVGRRSYIARIGEHEWVVRAGTDGPAGTLALADEAELMQAIAATGIAPAVIAVDPQADLLVTEYRAGAVPMSPERSRQPEQIARVAALLKRLHAIKRRLRAFDPEAIAAEYVGTLGAQRPLTAAQRPLANEFVALASSYRMRYPSMVVCHNDLVAANILDDGHLCLIDFEYAVLAAPVLDLAGLAAMNDYDDAQRWQLAEAYYGGAAVPFTPVELDKVVRLMRLMAYFWALSAASTAADPEPYEQFVHTAAAGLE